MARATWAISVYLLLTGVAQARQAVDYTRDIKPILKRHCYACHGALKQQGGLRLDTAAAVIKGGESGAAVRRADSADSLLIRRVTTTDDALRMPQEQSRLTAADVMLLKAWIDQGAVAPANEIPPADPRQHWAFQPPAAVTLPRIDNRDWIRNPVDAFIAEQHQRRGLTPSRPATRHVLLRRLYLDVLGVPPSREERARFLQDESADAYEQLVDRLLNSPGYGERWGRHWMDVWRYSDWYGRRRVPDVLNSYGQIWRWRDWIVRSVNEDKGYDRMLTEMLAADEVCAEDDQNVVATGFIVRNFYRWNYNNWMKDLVEHTGKAFLGLTLNCCHCHDHKYDPISNEEYFRFRAFFEPIEIRHDRVAGEPDPGPYPKYSYGKSYKPIASGMVRIFDEKLDAATHIYSGGEARNVIPGLDPVTPGVPAVLGGDALVVQPVQLPATAWYPALKSFVADEELGKRRADLEAMRAALVKARRLLEDAQDEAARQAAGLTLVVDQRNVARAEAELQVLLARQAADQARYLAGDGDPQALAKAASRAQRSAAHETVGVALARAERALWKARQAAQPEPDAKQTADIQQKEQAVRKLQKQWEQAQAALTADSEEYAALGPQYPRTSSGRRTALARWIASQRNPLTARVAVNHIWAWHFGRGLVATPENLGVSGARPTHPELLDWLAEELMAGGWRMKRIHRLLLTSNTYRMTSHNEPAAAQATAKNTLQDRDNTYLWRFQVGRMEAEMVRDSLLHLSGQLANIIGGREIAQDQGLISPRRSLYFEHHGEGRMPFLDLFDAADPCDCYRRQTSVRPQQALALANSQLALNQAKFLAARLTKSVGTSDTDSAEGAWAEAVIRAAFQQILTREPTAEEMRISRLFCAQQSALYADAAQTKTRSTDDPKGPLVATDLRVRAVTSLVQALFSHNDFLTIR